ncbi:hypothetical protein F5Y12DRAFT_773737 [Xylaria sp. FL1777]|nr:hypothetical protein F5Y12DRAFT_773737 [Xylaria sp. FL1777]
MARVDQAATKQQPPIHTNPTVPKTEAAGSLGCLQSSARSKLMIESRQHGASVLRSSSSYFSRATNPPDLQVARYDWRYTGHTLVELDDDNDSDDDSTLGLEGLTFGCSTPQNNGDGVAQTTTPPSKRAKLDDQNSVKLACPFMKHDPERYRTHRSCAWSSWPTVHRVKEHVSRRHRMPENRCSRCGQDFKSQSELSEHQHGDITCTIVPHSNDCISEDQLRMLQSRKGQRTMSEADKWVKMYSIIFPDGGVVPLPYHDPSEMVAQEPSWLVAHDRRLLGKLRDYAVHERQRLIQPGVDKLLNDARNNELDRDKIMEFAQGLIQQVTRDFESRGTPCDPEMSSTRHSPEQSDSVSRTLGRGNSLGLDLTLPQPDAPNQYHVGTSPVLQPMGQIEDFFTSELDGFEFVFHNFEPLSFPLDGENLSYPEEQT